MGIYGGNPHIPAENILCLLWMWIKGTMNSLPEWAEVQQMGGGGAWAGTRALERNHSQLRLLIPPTPSQVSSHLGLSSSHLTPPLRHRTVRG